MWMDSHKAMKHQVVISTLCVWVHACALSHVQLSMAPWTVTYQAPPSMEFSRQDYWSGLPFPTPGVLPNPGIEPSSPTLQVDPLQIEPPGKPTIGLRDFKGLLLPICIISILFLITTL